jgi:hypothetical protein
MSLPLYRSPIAFDWRGTCERPLAHFSITLDTAEDYQDCWYFSTHIPRLLTMR